MNVVLLTEVESIASLNVAVTTSVAPAACAVVGECSSTPGGNVSAPWARVNSGAT
jgi:hypothetical protein